MYLFQFQDEIAEKTEARVTRAVYRRAKVVKSSGGYIGKSLSCDNITSALIQANLVPIKNYPQYTWKSGEAQ